MRQSLSTGCGGLRRSQHRSRFKSHLLDSGVFLHAEEQCVRFFEPVNLHSARYKKQTVHTRQRTKNGRRERVQSGDEQGKGLKPDALEYPAR
jgi:hypothetical protein